MDDGNDNGTKVTFHEICAQPDWCIVQIVPMTQNGSDDAYEIGVSLIPDIPLKGIETDRTDRTNRPDKKNLPSEKSGGKEKVAGKGKGKKITTKKPPRAERRTIRLSSTALNPEGETPKPKKSTTSRQQKIEQFLSGVGSRI